MKLSSFLASLTLASATLAIAQTPPPSVPVLLGPSPNGPLAPICRLAVLNRDCTLYIDRRNPIAPSSIIVGHRHKVTIVVSNPSFLETLQLDPKSGSSAPPPDLSSSSFSSLTGTLSSIVLPDAPPMKETLAASDQSQNGSANTGANYSARIQNKSAIANKSEPPKAPEKPVVPLDKFNELLGQQNGLSQEINSAKKNLKATLQDPSLLITLGKLRTAVAKPVSIENPSDWKQSVLNSLQNTLRSLPNPEEATSLAQRLQTLTTSLATMLPADANGGVAIDKDHLALLNANQTTLNSAYAQINTTITNLRLVLNQMIAAIQNQPTAQPQLYATITDPGESEHDVESVVWNLDAVVPLSDSLSPIESMDKVGDSFSSSLGLIGKAPALNTILGISVTFKRAPFAEVSSGVLFPAMPYHTYSAATNSSGTTAVVKTPVWTVVPDAVLNFRIGPERAIQETRFAPMFSTAAGYSTSTSSAVFGLGPSFAIGPVVINMLAVASPDARLTGGFAAGSSLATGATAPATHTSWSVKPSIGISIHLPL